MLHFAARAALSGLIIAAIAALGRRSAALGGLVAALPLTSIIGMAWLWHDTHDRARLTQLAGSTMWYVLPSLPMFLIIPALLRAGWSFYPALGAGGAAAAALYGAVALLLR